MRWFIPIDLSIFVLFLPATAWHLYFIILLNIPNTNIIIYSWHLIKQTNFFFSIYLNIIIQSYAAIRLQAFYRGFMRGSKYRAAEIKRLQKRDIPIEKVFFAWKKCVHNILDAKKICKRRFFAWRNYLRKVKKLRELFRSCFWPFFVWRRYTGNFISYCSYDIIKSHHIWTLYTSKKIAFFLMSFTQPTYI